MSRKQSRKNKNRPSRPPLLKSDPSSLTTKEFFRQVPVRYWRWLAGAFVVVFIFVTRIGQTDLVMDVWGNRTRSKLEKERTAHTDTQYRLIKTQRELKTVQVDRGKLKHSLAEARTQHRILKLYEEDFWLYRSYTIPKMNGARINIGKCGGISCYSITLIGISKRNAVPQVSFVLSGAVFRSYGNAMRLSFVFKEKCGAIFHSGKQKFRIVVEDDSLTSLRIGLSIKNADKEYSQLSIEKIGCPVLP